MLDKIACMQTRETKASLPSLTPIDAAMLIIAEWKTNISSFIILNFS